MSIFRWKMLPPIATAEVPHPGYHMVTVVRHQRAPSFSVLLKGSVIEYNQELESRTGWERKEETSSKQNEGHVWRLASDGEGENVTRSVMNVNHAFTIFAMKPFIECLCTKTRRIVQSP